MSYCKNDIVMRLLSAGSLSKTSSSGEDAREGEGDIPVEENIYRSVRETCLCFIEILNVKTRMLIFIHILYIAGFSSQTCNFTYIWECSMLIQYKHIEDNKVEMFTMI